VSEGQTGEQLIGRDFGAGFRRKAGKFLGSHGDLTHFPHAGRIGWGILSITCRTTMNG